MDWLKPNLLWGLAGLAVPLAIHLLGRAKRRKIEFATVRFLLAARARASSKIKLKQLLLLLARMLAVALIALLFAGTGIVNPLTGGAHNTVIILDNSPSMAARRGGPTRLEEAKRLVTDHLDNAGALDRFAVITTGSGVGVEADPFIDRLAAKLLVSRTALAGEDAGLPRALELAQTLLVQKGGAGVLVATDMQKYAWRGIGFQSASPLTAQVIDVGFNSPANVWLSEVELSAGTIRVKAGGTVPPGEKLAVALKLDDGRKLTAFAGKEGRAEFRPALDAKPHLATLSLSPGGDMDSDDEATLALTEAGPVRVLLVNGDPKGGTLLDELHFVRLALASGGRFEKNFDVREVSQSDLTLERASGVDVVVLANPGPIPVEVAQGLLKLVEEGLGLVVAAGDRWQPEKGDEGLALLTAAPLRDKMLVAAFDPTRPPFEEAAPSSFAPPFAPGPDDAENMRAAPPAVTGYWVVDQTGKAGVKVLMRLANQVPLLASRAHGRGRLLLFASSFDRDWSDWCLKPSFVPFLEKLLTYGAGRSGAGLPVLAPIGSRLVSPFGQGVELARPDGSAGEWLPGEGFDVKLSGFHKVSAAGRLAGGFTGRGEAAESDLTRITQDELKTLGAKLGLEIAEGTSQTAGRRDLTPYLAAALLVALAFEALLSARRRAVRKLDDGIEPGEGDR